MPDDRKYFSFQLWQEGVARYIQIKSAEAAADYPAVSRIRRTARLYAVQYLRR